MWIVYSEIEFRNNNIVHLRVAEYPDYDSAFSATRLLNYKISRTTRQPDYVLSILYLCKEI